MGLVSLSSREPLPAPVALLLQPKALAISEARLRADMAEVHGFIAAVPQPSATPQPAEIAPGTAHNVVIRCDPAAVLSRAEVAMLAEMLNRFTGARTSIPAALGDRCGDVWTMGDIQALLAAQDSLLYREHTLSSYQHHPVFAGPDPPVSIRTASTPTLSAQIIVRDGMTPPADICRAMRSIAPVASEILVSDTGSADNTVDAVYGEGMGLPCDVRVFRDPWEDHFGNARNRLIERTECEWIWWLDADDEVPVQTLPKILEWLALVPPEPYNEYAGFTLRVAGPGIIDGAMHLRLFRNHRGYRFRHAIHESQLDSVQEGDGYLGITKAVVWHHGYEDPKDSAKKKLRNDAVAAKWDEDPVGEERTPPNESSADRAQVVIMITAQGEPGAARIQMVPESRESA